MGDKAQTEVTGYDLSSTGTIADINCESLLELGWIVVGGSATDYAVDIQPEGSSNWYTIDTYSGVTSIDDGVVSPEAGRVRIRNTATVSDTADVVLGVGGDLH
jgi:hypothetical protein